MNLASQNLNGRGSGMHPPCSVLSSLDRAPLSYLIGEEGEDFVKNHKVDGDNIISINGKKISLTRRGREFHALCPFHEEKTPSFTVTADLKSFHCFGCGAHGELK